MRGVETPCRGGVSYFLGYAAEVDAAGARSAAAGGGGGGGGQRFAVIGHRGKGMNALASPDRRMQEVKENSLRSFNEAARFPVDYVEFDVQVTKKNSSSSVHPCPSIRHSGNLGGVELLVLNLGVPVGVRDEKARPIKEKERKRGRWGDGFTFTWVMGRVAGFLSSMATRQRHGGQRSGGAA